MRTLIVSAATVVLLLSFPTYASEPAEVGRAFADVYGAFAPLSVIHRSYADFLFYGTDVAIPDGLGEACTQTSYLLATLYLDLIVQTGPEVMGIMPRLARLRVDMAVFCERHSQILTTLALLKIPDLTLLSEASALGVFSEIYRLQAELQSVFEAYLDALVDEQDVWEFGIAFSLKTLLAQADLVSIDPGLQAILYGSEDALTPPQFVSNEIISVIEQLLMFVDVPLDGPSLIEVQRLAQLILEYVVGQP